MREDGTSSGNGGRKTSMLVCYCDGGCKGQGPLVPKAEWRGDGAYKIGDESVVHLTFGGAVTNNICEYMALIALLEELVGRYDGNVPSVEVRMDSALVVGQVYGIPPGSLWRCKDKDLRLKLGWVEALLCCIHGFSLVHISGDEMKEVVGQ